MPAKDIFHDAVKNALIKDGWTITDDPFNLDVGGVEMAVDLGAEKLLAAKKADQKIAVEIKSFIAPSNIYELHTAVGQFIHYRIALSVKEPKRVLFLAVPDDIYKTFLVFGSFKNRLE